MRVHRPLFTQFSRLTDLFIYLGTVAFLTIALFVLRQHNLGGMLYFYTSPFVVLGAMYLLLFFSKVSLHSSLVNWVAASALAIYLTHSSCFLGKYYDGFIRQWFYEDSRLEFIVHAVLLIAAVFVGSILLDKVRLWLWARVKHPFGI